MQITLGGKRLGSGKRNNVELHGFERSTHNLTEVIRTTMAPGPLYPVMVKVGLPGDVFEIDLGLDVKTLPTNGPLYGSYDIYVNVFAAEIALYNRALMINETKVGLDMSQVKFPQIRLRGNNPDITEDNFDVQQISSSCILCISFIRGM